MYASNGIVLTDLEEIEFRCRAATPGPWESYVVGRDTEAGLNCIGTGDAHFLEVVGGTVADQDFIAGAREDIPKLIAEVRRLRAELKALRTSGVPVPAFLGDSTTTSNQPTAHL
jgi:hypothetical protein